MDRAQELQNQLEIFKGKNELSHTYTLLGLFLMITGGGLCFIVQNESRFITGLIPLVIGLILFISGSIKASIYARKIKKVKKELGTIDPSRFDFVKTSIGKTIWNVILIILTLAIIGIGGCFAFFGLMSVGGAF